MGTVRMGEERLLKRIDRAGVDGMRGRGRLDGMMVRERR